VLGLSGPDYARDSSGDEDDRGVNPPPAPPEVPSSGLSATLLWRSPSTSMLRTQPARHPLLCIAAAASTSPVRPQSRPFPWSRLRETAIRLRQQSAPRFSERSSRAAAAHLPFQRGEPLVVVIGGGRGGAGRTTLAMELATALAASQSGAARRVLLVDADPIHSDLDVKLGVADLDSDRCPSARIDRVLLQLPELADRRLHLDSLLWVHPNSGVRALLAPDRAVEIGREHLDYLYAYILAPSFDAIVVDAGPALDIPTLPLSRSAAFWLEHADSVLVPIRPTLSDSRSAVAGVHLFERMGVPTKRCRMVMGVARAESSTATTIQRRLSEFVIWRWPWAPEVAHRAGLAHRPLAEFDRRLEQSIASLVSDLATGRRAGH
jgi:cellulose biosynthesis protein BcsQ